MSSLLYSQIVLLHHEYLAWLWLLHLLLELARIGHELVLLHWHLLLRLLLHWKRLI